MKKKSALLFISKAIILVILLFGLDYLLGMGLGKLYFAQTKGQLAQTTYSVDSAKQDILVFGSSRAVRHYSPSILTNGTNLSCYNVGRDAERMPYYIALQEVILKRTTPKLIILDVNSTELRIDESKYTKLSILLPYCESHPELLNYIKEISEFEKYKLTSKTYPYNSLLMIMFYNQIFKNKLPKEDNGYLPLTRKLTKNELEEIAMRRKLSEAKNGDKQNNALDTKSVMYYDNFLLNTSTNNIKTLVIISPMLLKEKEAFMKQELKNIAKKYPNVTFLDYSNAEEFNFEHEKFSDGIHLNNVGAEEFSKMINKKITAVI